MFRCEMKVDAELCSFSQIFDSNRLPSYDFNSLCGDLRNVDEHFTDRIIGLLKTYWKTEESHNFTGVKTLLLDLINLVSGV